MKQFRMVGLVVGLGLWMIGWMGFRPVVSQATVPAKIGSGLQEHLQAESTATYLVYLAEQADLSAAAGILDWSEKGWYVYRTLWDMAQHSQVGLLSWLATQEGVQFYRSFYIVNAILVKSDESTVQALAQNPMVAQLELMEDRFVLPMVAETETVEWGIVKIGADEVWNNFGERGAGAVVAHIGTGVQANHAALANQYRGTQTGSHDYNWLDTTGTFPMAPNDDNGNGTHLTGTMVGDDGAGNQIGVAPEAQWIAVKACSSFGACSQADLLEAAEWILAPYPIGGNPGQGDPAMRPHVVQNTWGGAGGDPWFQPTVQAWRSAGIFPVFGAGGGGTPGSIASPADYAESFGVGATDSNDIIASFSGRGPSSLTLDTKPDATAPGVGIRSSVLNNGYATYNGTTMASSHSAGCAVLLFAANSDLTDDGVEMLLQDTAVDLGAPGPDNDYGHGRIDCYQAVYEGANWMRSAGIFLWSQPLGGGYLLNGLVLVLDKNGVRVDGAEVDVSWTLPNGSTRQQTGTTNNGLARFRVFTGNAGTSIFTVNDISKTNHLFNLGDSILTKTITTLHGR